MRVISGIAILTFCGAWATVAAQTADAPLSALEAAVACSAPLSMEGPPANALHVTGTQDTSPRSLYGPGDLLVISGGTNAGVQLGQQYFARRTNHFGGVAPRQWQGARTLGWVRVVGVNDSTAIAAIDHLCDALAEGDYLEPFVAPVVPADAERDVAGGDPDFSSLGRVMSGRENRESAGAGDFMLIDRGTDQGAVPGARYAIYRDVGQGGMPLAAIGEAVVVSAGKTMSLTRITRSRDAVMSGDYVALRR